MYQKFKTEVLCRLAGMDAETLQAISKAMDMVGDRYELTPKETALTVRAADGLPEPVMVYLVTRKIEGLSEKTLDLYKRQLTKLFLMCKKPLDKITANDIRIFLYTYQEQTGISNRTLDGFRAAFSAFFRWAAAEGYIQSDPTATIKKIKYEARHRDALSQMELEIFRHHCETPREKALTEFLFSTGCRVSEVAGAKLSEIDWAKGELVVLGKGNKHRTVFINAKATVSLKEYIISREDDTDAIFVSNKAPHTALSVSALEREIAAVASRCTEINKPITPHIFRHSTATTMAQAGVPIQDVAHVLGHVNVSTTMIYAEVSEANVKAEHKRHVV